MSVPVFLRRSHRYEPILSWLTGGAVGRLTVEEVAAEQVFRRGRGLFMALIGVLATGVLCAQSYAFLQGFVWALIHGAGAASFRGFLPAALSVAMLWAGYVVLTRINVTRRTLGFTVYALGIVLMNELLLPGTPLKMVRAARDAQAVEVRSVRDEVVLSARGNPIGIRITFDAVVPRTGEYSISASALSRVADDVFWPLTFGHSNRIVTHPPPSRGNDVYDVFQKGVVYTFTTDLLPEFLSFEEPGKEPCLVNITSRDVSEADFVAALEKSRSMKYRGEIHVSNASSMRSAVVHEYMTTRDYDVEAMYRTIGVEGNRRCGQ